MILPALFPIFVFLHLICLLFHSYILYQQMVLTPYKLNEVVDIPHLILNMKHQKNQTAIGKTWSTRYFFASI